MQSTRQALSLTAVVRRNFIRTVAVNSGTVNEVQESELKSWREIPGPPSYPIIGPFLSFLPGSELGDLKTFQEIMYKKFGPIVRLDSLLGRPPMIFLYDPECIATVLRNENVMPERPGFQSLTYFRKIYNKTKEQQDKPTGLITDDGDLWRQFRTTVNPIMLQPKTIKLYTNVLDEVAEDMVNRMKSKRNEKNMIDAKFDVEMNLWALESIGVVALGGRLGCLKSDLPDDSPARKLIQNVHDFFQISNALDFKPSLWRYVSTPLFKKAMKTYAEQEETLRYFVKKAMEDLKGKNTSDDQKGILEKLLEIDEDTAVIMANDMLFAGVDSSATSITSMLYLMAKNQDKQDKLREEVTSGSGEKTYLKACLKENQRLMPVVSGNMRKVTKDYHLLGYKIPKGMILIFTHELLSRMEEHYPRANEFLPERWYDKNAPYYYTNAHPFTYSPFGFGVRGCIGRRIAELEMEIFLAKLIQNFKLEWFGPPIVKTPVSLNYLQPPFNFIFKDV